MRMDLMHRHAADLGIEVEWHDLGPKRRGDYCDQLRVIRLNHRLTRVQATATLAHEVGHAIMGDTSSSRWIEDRADQIGASLAISVDDYATAEALVGSHAGALARELEVTHRLVLAWRRWYRRTHHALERVA